MVDELSVNLVDLGNCENLKNSVDQSVSETVIVITSDAEEEGTASVGSENGKGVDNGNEKSNATEEENVLESKTEDSKDDKQSSLVVVVVADNDVKCGGNLDGERVCRICHLNSDPSLTDSPSPRTTTTMAAAAAETVGLIELGCGCKDELGIVHSHCAEAWFKVKGNRQCEICGETAENVTGVGDDKFMEKWNHDMNPSASGNGTLSQHRFGEAAQRVCHLLTLCLIFIFSLLWSIRTNT